MAGQIPDLVGAPAEGRFAVEGVQRVARSASINPASLAVGLGAVAILVLVDRTPWASFAAIVALAIPTIAVVLLDATGVAVVSDVGEIPQGLPVPHLPELSRVTLDVIIGAIAVAAIVLVQGSGVAESAATGTARARTPTRTSSHRARAISRPPCSAGFPSGGPSDRRR